MIETETKWNQAIAHIWIPSISYCLTLFMCVRPSLQPDQLIKLPLLSLWHVCCSSFQIKYWLFRVLMDWQDTAHLTRTKQQQVSEASICWSAPFLTNIFTILTFLFIYNYHLFCISSVSLTPLFISVRRVNGSWIFNNLKNRLLLLF